MRTTRAHALVLATAAIALSSFCPIKATASEPGERVAPAVEQVKLVSQRFEHAAMADDIYTMGRLLARDYEAVNASGRVQTKSDILDAHRYGRVHFEAVLNSKPNIEIDGDTAVERCTSFVKGVYMGTRFDGVYSSTRTFRRQPDGRWLIVRLIVRHGEH